ncbi:uncharacterized protein LOC125777195 isoform X2 [Bactrocera dorsalis]|uniref:Uncharacterized protein LOC125777195 isoform X2 n=1 Tax=Bactrocera dorsalis TaxID=27457 RepID=A0ABM3JDX6_BACDO|nr:uncharacterized protein LOC125777195 isoform X2 [Bactrocera dorsalis]
MTIGDRLFVSFGTARPTQQHNTMFHAYAVVVFVEQCFNFYCSLTLLHFLEFSMEWENTIGEANTQYFKKNKRKAQFILDFKERKRKRLTRRKRNHLDHW